jgi:uncharacterized protein (DUF1800 family)
MHRTLRLAAFALLTTLSSQADLDLDSDGLGDVWEAKFQPAGLLPDRDDDGDGRSNREESEAGTDPLRADDLFAIREIAAEAGSLRLKWPAQPGKRYQIQTTGTPGIPGSWQNLPGLLPGDAAGLEQVVPRPASASAFFRIAVADIDSDGDGLDDWEELQAGYDPNADHVHPCHCGESCDCGPGCQCGGNDLQRLSHALQQTPVIHVEASDPEATEPAGSGPAEPGKFTIRRSGGIARVTIALHSAGSAGSTDFSPLPPTLTLPFAAGSAELPVIPLADTLAESTELIQLSAAPAADYSIGSTAPASVLIHDRVEPNGSGLLGSYWKHPNRTNHAPYFTGAPGISRIEPTVNFVSTTTPVVYIWPGPPVSASTSLSEYFSSRWEGEVLPEYSQAYTFYAHADEACRLWVDGKLIIDNWPTTIPTPSLSERSAILQVEGGKRYPIVFEHYNNGGGHRAVLSWQSASQTKQVIPRSRLFPDTPPRIHSPYEALAFVDGPAFNYQIQASARPTSYDASNLPPGFAINPATGLITGTPATPGEWLVTLTATNAKGSGSAFLQLTVIDAGGGITRELWNDVPGGSVAQIPLSTAPDATSLLASLESPADSGDAYGARIRGFLTAPASGDYRFFLRGDESAVFHLSDDEEPVNAWQRAALSAPTSSTDWTGAAASPLLRLEAGRRYYLEILHKEDAGGDHLALGWAKPGQPDNVPSEIVPGYVLTRFEDVALGSSPDGTLLFTPLTPQAGALTNAYGSCTLRLSADKTTAWVTPTYGNLGSPFQGMHVHDSRLPSTSNIVFDLDEPGVEILADGSHVWHIQDTGTLTAAEIADGLGQHAFFNVHTVNYPGGEIKGFFRALDGSATYTPPPAPPSWSSDPLATNSDAKAAARFLQQATFGASPADIAALQALPSFDAWLDAEIAKPATLHLPYVEANRNVTDLNTPYDGNLTFNSWWKHSIVADDQLRQRVAFALSQIMVVSESGPLDNRAQALSDYYDTLLQHAFGNARDLIEAVTLHPAMGRYLDMLRNDKPDLSAGRIPNENYAREILQLFSLGLYRFHPDGSLILNSKGLPIPVYDQEAIIGYAHVFTGWGYDYTGAYRTSFPGTAVWTAPMREVPARHFTGRKRLLNNVVLPGLPKIGSTALDPYATPSSTALADPAFQALATRELDAVHDQIFQHPNFGPFLCRQLIQRLVTSTPSRGYIHRVVSKFNDNGSGVRGDLAAVVKAILLDYEARSPVAAAAPGYGKQREPVIRVTQFARAFRPTTNFAGTWVQDGGLIIATTTAPHRLASGQGVLLGFTGTPAATDGPYTLSTSNPPTATTFTVRTKDIHRSTWAQSGTTITVTTPSNHSFKTGQPVHLRFRDGGAGVLVSGTYQVGVAGTSSTNLFTFTAPDSATRSGTCDVSWLRGVYTQSHIAGVTTLTVTTGTANGLSVGHKLDLRFTPDSGQTLVQPDGTYTVATVDPTDPRRVTLTPDSGVQSTLDGRSGTFHAAPLTPVPSRSGDVVSGYSDWNVGGTDTDLGQTPLRAPTVFNFFEPDYRFPGLLAGNGLTTPEFQISSDTNVIRQSNFLFGGIYATSRTDSATGLTSGFSNGFSSFRYGSHDLAMDFSPWMGARTSGSDYWTNTANLRDLIRTLSGLLMAGQMSPAMEDRIHNFVSDTANITYPATPADTDRRNRLRAILYLIAVSPEHAIQR